MTYTSMPDLGDPQLSPFDTDAHDRTGNPSDPGGSVNNLATSASVAYTITQPAPPTFFASNQDDDVAATKTTVTSSLNPSIYGQSVTFTATVVNIRVIAMATTYPTGSVAFYDGSTELGIGTSLRGSQTSSTSTFTISTLTAGTHSLTARLHANEQFSGQHVGHPDPRLSTRRR